jgi:hypothetical protein
MKLKRHVQFLKENNSFEIGLELKDIEFEPITAEGIVKLLEKENPITKIDIFIRKFESKFSNLYLITGKGRLVLYALNQGERYMKDTYGEYYGEITHKLKELLNYKNSNNVLKDNEPYGYTIHSKHSGWINVSIKSFNDIGNLISLDPHTGTLFYICDEEFKNELEEFIKPLKTLDKYNL